MVDLQSHLNSFTKLDQIQDLNQLLFGMIPSTTCLGSRVIEIKGYTGSVYLDDVTRIVNTMGDTFVATQSKLETKQRNQTAQAGTAIAQKVHLCYQITDKSIWESDLLTQLMNWIQDWLSTDNPRAHLNSSYCAFYDTKMKMHNAFVDQIASHK